MTTSKFKKILKLKKLDRYKTQCDKILSMYDEESVYHIYIVFKCNNEVFEIKYFQRKANNRNKINKQIEEIMNEDTDKEILLDFYTIKYSTNKSFFNRIKSLFSSKISDKKIFAKLSKLLEEEKELYLMKIFKNKIVTWIDYFYEFVINHYILGISLFITLFLIYESTYLYSNNFIYDEIDFERLFSVSQWLAVLTSLILVPLFLILFVMFIAILWFENSITIKRFFSVVLFLVFFSAFSMLTYDILNYLYKKEELKSEFAKEYIKEGKYPSFVKVIYMSNDTKTDVVLARYIAHNFLYFNSLSDFNITAIFKDYNHSTPIIIRCYKNLYTKHIKAINLKEVKLLEDISDTEIERKLREKESSND